MTRVAHVALVSSGRGVALRISSPPTYVCGSVPALNKCKADGLATFAPGLFIVFVIKDHLVPLRTGDELLYLVLDRKSVV